MRSISEIEPLFLLTDHYLLMLNQDIFMNLDLEQHLVNLNLAKLCLA